MFYSLIRSCFTCIKLIPVVFITLLVAWSYYAFLFHFCLDCVKNLSHIVWILVPYHFIFILFTWSYYKTYRTPTPKPPNDFFISSEKAGLIESCKDIREVRRILSRASRLLPISCRSFTGGVRYCKTCKCLKPDRSHHCSVCNQCVLKMDHHCPWVNNCVSFTNYKYFVLFLWYGEIYCLFITLLTYSSITDFMSTPGLSMHVVMLWIFSSLFAFGLLLLSSLHSYLIFKNLTTIEMLQVQTFVSGPVKNGFYLGMYENFIQIFGRVKKRWFLPLFTSLGDGVTFPINPLHSQQVRDTLNTLNQKWMEEGINGV